MNKACGQSHSQERTQSGMLSQTLNPVSFSNQGIAILDFLSKSWLANGAWMVECMLQDRFQASMAVCAILFGNM